MKKNIFIKINKIKIVTVIISEIYIMYKYNNIIFIFIFNIPQYFSKNHQEYAYVRICNIMPSDYKRDKLVIKIYVNYIT